eukprot:2827801-Prymnesium_polylepis.1
MAAPWIYMCKTKRSNPVPTTRVTSLFGASRSQRSCDTTLGGAARVRRRSHSGLGQSYSTDRALCHSTLGPGTSGLKSAVRAPARRLKIT